MLLLVLFRTLVMQLLTLAKPWVDVSCAAEARRPAGQLLKLPGVRVPLAPLLARRKCPARQRTLFATCVVLPLSRVKRTPSFAKVPVNAGTTATALEYQLASLGSSQPVPLVPIRVCIVKANRKEKKYLHFGQNSIFEGRGVEPSSHH